MPDRGPGTTPPVPRELVPASAYVSFVARAGLRGSLERGMVASAWRCGLDVDVQKSSGLLKTAYRFTVTGEPEVVAAWIESAAELLERIKARSRG